MSCHRPIERVGEPFSRRVFLARTGAFTLAAWGSRSLGADPEVDATKDLLRRFDAARPMARACKEAQDLLKAALKLHGPMQARIMKAWEENGAPKVRTPAHDLFEAWNDVLTLSVFHKARGKEKYATYDGWVAYNWIKVGYPISKRWTITYPSRADDQLSATLVQNHLGKDPARTIKVWYYRWDTTYSGVGGENAQKLAEVSLEADKAVMATGNREVSKKVEIQRLNAGFPRAYTYVVRGEDEEFKGEVRRKNWYLKGKAFTANIEVIERLAVGLDEDPVTQWHREGPCPEIEALLESVTENEAS